HHQQHPVRRRQPGPHADVLRRDDGPGCRGHDAVARLLLFEGPRPGAFPAPPEDERDLRQDALEPQAPLEVQSVAAVPAVPHGQVGLRVHAVGHAGLQHLRLAATVLPAAGRLRRHVHGADGDDALGAVRPPQRQREMQGLHGSLRVRGHGRRYDLRIVEGPHGGRPGDADGAVVSDERAESLEGWTPGPVDASTLTEIVERAFDYGGAVTLPVADGRGVEGYLFNRDRDVVEPFVQVFPRGESDSSTIPYARIREIRFTGKDTAAGNSYAAWRERRQAAKAAPDG